MNRETAPQSEVNPQRAEILLASPANRDATAKDEVSNPSLERQVRRERRDLASRYPPEFFGQAVQIKTPLIKPFSYRSRNRCCFILNAGIRHSPAQRLPCVFQIRRMLQEKIQEPRSATQFFGQHEIGEYPN